MSSAKIGIEKKKKAREGEQKKKNRSFSVRFTTHFKKKRKIKDTGERNVPSLRVSAFTKRKKRLPPTFENGVVDVIAVCFSRFVVVVFLTPYCHASSKVSHVYYLVFTSLFLFFQCNHHQNSDTIQFFFLVYTVVVDFVFSLGST